MIAAVILGVIALALLYMVVTDSGDGVTGASVAITSDQAGEKVVDFAKFQGANLDLVEVVDNGTFYEVIVLIEGQEIPLYVTKDGEYLAQLIPLKTVQAPAQTTNTPTQNAPVAYSPEDIGKLKEFSVCLASKGVKIYGANWCGWTQRWVDTLGGASAITPIYVECTENEAICSSENVTGYPTTKINGESYSDARTVEAIALATGCPAPLLDNDLSSSNANQDAASC